MIALAFALSCAKLFEMPMGGSVTVASMLPIMLVSIKFGMKTGIATSFLYSLTQLLQALASANVFPYCETPATLILCILFDYVVPFTLLGLAGIFLKFKLSEKSEINVYYGISLVVALRFLCHFVTGVAIWGQWAPEGMGAFVYSLVYNGSYMLPELVVTLLVSGYLLTVSAVEKLLNKEN